MPSPPPNRHITTNSIYPQIPSPPAGGAPHRFTTKLRRLNYLILLLRFAAFSFCLAAAIFMAANSSRHGGNPTWSDFGLFRYVVAANGIAAAYSMFETAAAMWEIVSGSTILPESLQLWFDFSHDQVFTYMLLAAVASGVSETHNVSKGDTCTEDNSFCIQAYISVSLGFVGFAFLALSALLSGYRLVSFMATGSRYHA